MLQFTNGFSLLLLLQPHNNRPPPRYFEHLIRNNNRDISKFIDIHQGMIDNNTYSYFVINYPHDIDAEVAWLLTFANYDKTAISSDKLYGEPIVNYYYIYLCSIDDIYAALNEIFNIELTRLQYKPNLSSISINECLFMILAISSFVSALLITYLTKA